MVNIVMPSGQCRALRSSKKTSIFCRLWFTPIINVPCLEWSQPVVGFRQASLTEHIDKWATSSCLTVKERRLNPSTAGHFLNRWPPNDRRPCRGILYIYGIIGKNENKNDLAVISLVRLYMKSYTSIKCPDGKPKEWIDRSCFSWNPTTYRRLSIIIMRVSFGRIQYYKMVDLNGNNHRGFFCLHCKLFPSLHLIHMQHVVRKSIDLVR